MKKFMFWLGTIYCLVLSMKYANATDLNKSITPFLTNSFSIRAEGMGDALAAVDADETGAEGWNPAVLSGTYPFEINTAYVRRVSETDMGIFSSVPINQNIVIGGGASLYDASKAELNSKNGREAFATTPRTFLAALTSAVRLNMMESQVDLGCNLKALSLARDDFTTATYGAMDLGIRFELYNLLEHLKFGFALKNLVIVQETTESTTLDSRPEYILAGLAYSLVQEPGLDILIAADTHCTLAKTWAGNLGTEFRFGEWFAVRGGYKTGFEQGANVGIGFITEAVRVDYGLSLPANSNSTHSIGISLAFGNQFRDSGNQHLDSGLTDSNITPTDVFLTHDQSMAVPVTKICSQLPARKIYADIVGIQRIGARATDVVLNVGAKQQIQIGYVGVIINSTGMAVAGIHVWDVYPDYCYANIISLGRDIEKKTRAMIEVPR